MLASGCSHSPPVPPPLRRPYICKVVKLEPDAKRGGCICTVQWFYRPEDPGESRGLPARWRRAHQLMCVAQRACARVMLLCHDGPPPHPRALAGMPGGRRTFHGERELVRPPARLARLPASFLHLPQLPCRRAAQRALRAHRRQQQTGCRPELTGQLAFLVYQRCTAPSRPLRHRRVMAVRPLLPAVRVKPH